MPLDRAHSLTATNVTLSLLLSVVLFGWYFALDSSLALAQAADSLIDVLTAVLLAWAVRVSQKPGDSRHPAGHRSAEPLAALWVAALAVLLGLRVAADATIALWTRSPPEFSLLLLLTFAFKAVVRGAIVIGIDRTPREALGPAMLALRVDARNDVLLSLGSVVAAFASRFLPWADPVVALPMALWLGWSGFELARENARLLMGEAPSERRLAELRELVGCVEGVRGVHNLTAHALGAQLGVRVHVEVDPNLLAGEAHDLGERVRVAVEAESDVDRCDVHIDVEGPDEDGD